MKLKKIIMIIILVIFIGFICSIINKINRTSLETSKSIENINNTTDIAEVSKNNNTIRKSTEKSKIDLNNMIEITDKFFIEQTNDVYLNLNDYIGKTIKIEGLIYSYEDTNGDICYAVVRNTPGCCGNDGLAGLDIRYDEEYPEENTWVEVIGIVGIDTMYGDKIPAIQVSSLTVKEKGMTFVTN